MQLRDYLAQPGNSQEKFALRLGCSQGLVSQWLAWLDGKRDRNATRITAERALEIEAATDGQVSRADLRPDLFQVSSVPVPAEQALDGDEPGHQKAAA